MRQDAQAGPTLLQPDGWPRPRGYANGVAARGRVLFVSGQVGWDPVSERMIETDFAGQTRQALENVLAVLRSGGAGPEHVTRLTWYVADLEPYRAARPAIGTAFRSLFGGHFPAMSVIQVAALLDPGALVEIEATAVVPD